VAERDGEASGLSAGRLEAMRGEDLSDDVELVDAPMRVGAIEGEQRFALRKSLQRGTPTSITKTPPGSICAAALRKQAAWVVRLLIVLKTR
jgi:hypothetical protein